MPAVLQGTLPHSGSCQSPAGPKGADKRGGAEQVQKLRNSHRHCKIRKSELPLHKRRVRPQLRIHAKHNYDPLMQVKETLTGEVRRTESPRSNLSSPSHTSTKVQLSTCIDLSNISTLYGRQCTRVQEEGLPLRGTHYRSKGTAL